MDAVIDSAHILMFEGRLTPHYAGSLLRRIPDVTHHPENSPPAVFTDTSKSFSPSCIPSLISSCSSEMSIVRVGSRTARRRNQRRDDLSASIRFIFWMSRIHKHNGVYCASIIKIKLTPGGVGR